MPKTLFQKSIFAAGLSVLAVLTFPSSRAFATETDPYTYSDVELNEASPQVNQAVQDILDRVQRRVNQKISAESVPSIVTDEQIELWVSEMYRKVAFPKAIFKMFHPIEYCIDHGPCEEYPSLAQVQRVLLTPQESIYGRSRYSLPASKVVAATVQMCGSRIGTDKFSHMLADGFFYYNAARDVRMKLGDIEAVQSLAVFDEENLMGGINTKVISHGDTAANMAGVAFFTNLLTGPDSIWFRDNDSGLLVSRRPVDLCGYVTAQMDETQNANTFSGSKKRQNRLNAAIELAIEEANERVRTQTPEQAEVFRDQILGRQEKFHLPFIVTLSTAAKTLFTAFVGGGRVIKTIRIALLPPDSLEDRRPIRISRFTPQIYPR